MSALLEVFHRFSPKGADSSTPQLSINGGVKAVYERSAPAKATKNKGSVSQDSQSIPTPRDQPLSFGRRTPLATVQGGPSTKRHHLGATCSVPFALGLFQQCTTWHTVTLVAGSPGPALRVHCCWSSNFSCVLHEPEEAEANRWRKRSACRCNR